jgi:hypothetical protein
MATMNPVRDLLTFIRLHWLAIALVAVIVVASMRYNRYRFAPVPASDGFPPQVIDTRTGQYCDPWPEGMGRESDSGLPKCSNLAKRWW